MEKAHGDRIQSSTRGARLREEIALYCDRGEEASGLSEWEVGGSLAVIFSVLSKVEGKVIC